MNNNFIPLQYKRQTIQRFTESRRFLGVRYGSAVVRDYPVHAFGVPFPHCLGVLCALRNCTFLVTPFVLSLRSKILTHRVFKSRFTILLLLAFMEFCLTLVNHFPLFALMLRVKDPLRLPGQCRAFVSNHSVRNLFETRWYILSAKNIQTGTRDELQH